MTPYRLSRRLTLEYADRVSDGAGGYQEIWQALGVLWAYVETRSGRRRQNGGTEVSDVRYRIVVRAAPEGSDMRPCPDQRFRMGAKSYLIDAVAPLNGNDLYLECWAREEQAL